MQAVSAAGHSSIIKIGLDVAASEMAERDASGAARTPYRYRLYPEREPLSSDEMVEVYQVLRACPGPRVDDRVGGGGLGVGDGDLGVGGWGLGVRGEGLVPHLGCLLRTHVARASLKVLRA
jgi:hypothetical protein